MISLPTQALIKSERSIAESTQASKLIHTVTANTEVGKPTLTMYLTLVESESTTSQMIESKTTHEL